MIIKCSMNWLMFEQQTGKRMSKKRCLIMVLGMHGTYTMLDNVAFNTSTYTASCDCYQQEWHAQTSSSAEL
jgi:hypothetical protein